MLTIITMIFMSAQATFAASVTITPAAAGTFSIHGDAMDGVAGIDMTISYDSASLSSPTVSQGGLVAGALMAVNTNNPGAIKIAIISTKAFSGSGQIATVTFATQNGTGAITSASVNLINNKGRAIAAQVSVSGGNATATTTADLNATAGEQPSQPDSGSTTTTATTTNTTTVGSSSRSVAPAASVPTYLGTVSMASDVQTRSDTVPVDTSNVPVHPTEAATTKQAEPAAEEKPGPEPQKAAKATRTSYKGILEDFRTYKGVKTPASYIALCDKKIAPTIRQEPAVALSDGKTPVKIVMELEGTDDKSPNFALNGAKLISLNSGIGSSITWIVEAMPQTGVVQASLSILTDSETIEYPLTIAPLIRSFSPTESDFVVFLTDSGAVPPKQDLNGDGRHDYLDDFIYTANYLTRKGPATKKSR